MTDEKPIVDGIYRIRAASMQTYVVDIANGSTVDGEAFPFLCWINADVYGGNHQRFRFDKSGNGNWRIRAAHSGLFMDTTYRGGVPESGATIPIITCSLSDTPCQEWVLTEQKSNEGDTAYFILNAGLQNWCWDAEFGIAYGHHVILHEKGESNVFDTQHRLWVLTRDTLVSPQYSVPIAAGAMSTKGTSGVSNAAVQAPITVGTEGGTIYPTWICSLSANPASFQFRVKVEGRYATSSSRDDFYEIKKWHCPYVADTEEAEENDGWADCWDDYVAVGKTDDTKLEGAGNIWQFVKGMTASFQAKYDCLRYTIEVRQFSREGKVGAVTGPVVGGSYTGVVHVCQRADLDFYNFRVTSKGLEIDYNSSFERDGNTITISGIKGDDGRICGSVTFANMPYRGTLTIPTSKLYRIPSHLSEVTVDATITTCDGAVSASTGLGEVTLPRTDGLEIDYELNASAGYCSTVTIKNFPEAKVWLEARRDGEPYLSDCEEITTDEDLKAGNRRFLLVPPFDTETRVCVFAVSAQNQEGIAELSLSPVTYPSSYLFNFGEDFVSLPFNASCSYELQRDVATYQTNGKAREDVYFGTGAAGTITLSGTIAPEGDIPISKYKNCAYEDFKRLSMSGYAVLRTPQGERHDVVITSANASEDTKRLRTVQVTCRERA